MGGLDDGRELGTQETERSTAPRRGRLTGKPSSISEARREPTLSALAETDAAPVSAAVVSDDRPEHGFEPPIFPEGPWQELDPAVEERRRRRLLLMNAADVPEPAETEPAEEDDGSSGRFNRSLAEGIARNGHKDALPFMRDALERSPLAARHEIQAIAGELRKRAPERANALEADLASIEAQMFAKHSEPEAPRPLSSRAPGHVQAERRRETSRRYAEDLQRQVGPDVSVAPSDDGRLVQVTDCEGRVLASLPAGPHRGFLREPEELAERLRFFADWQAGKLTPDQVEQGFRALAGSFDPSDEQALKTLRRADAAIRRGEDPGEAYERVAAEILMRPEPELDDVKAFVLDVLPGIGNLRSAQDAIESFDALREALENDDWAAAAEAGLFTALDAVGTVPGIGPFAKLAGRAAKTAVLKRTPVGKVHAQRRVFKSMDRSVQDLQSDDVRTVFGEAFDRLDTDQQKLLRGLWPNIKGKAGEKDVQQTLKRASFGNVSTEGKDVRKKVTLEDGVEKTRVFDADVEREFQEGTFLWFWHVVRPGKRGKTAIEVKTDKGRLTRQQEKIDSIINDKNKRRAQENADQLPVKVEHLRWKTTEIDPDLLRTQASELLGEHRTRIDSETADELIDALMSYRNPETGSPLLMGEFIAGLARAADHLLVEETDDSPDYFNESP